MNDHTEIQAMDKFDIFVMLPKRIPRLIPNSIEVKLMYMFWCRLTNQGIPNITLGIESISTFDSLTDLEIKELTESPFFLSEHYLSRSFHMELPRRCREYVRHPFKTRPSLDAYSFANYGKPPKFHVMFVGAVNTGKTILLTEFKLMLKEISSDIEIVHCENGIEPIIEWPEKDYVEIHNYYLSRSKDLNFNIGASPTYRINIDGTSDTNTKV